jgi:four helix bundle protein
VRDYNKLQVWQKAHALTLAVHKLTLQLPREHGALRSQMRRAAESISTNIVEGCSRRGQKDFAHFLQISIGSCGELEYQLRLAFDYKAISFERWTTLHNQTIEVRRMLIGLCKKVRSDAVIEASSTTANSSRV